VLLSPAPNAIKYNVGDTVKSIVMAPASTRESPSLHSQVKSVPRSLSAVVKSATRAVQSAMTGDDIFVKRQPLMKDTSWMPAMVGNGIISAKNDKLVRITVPGTIQGALAVDAKALKNGLKCVSSIRVDFGCLWR
jgi:hypothetical protein